jgi:hypothetical protein
VLNIGLAAGACGFSLTTALTVKLLANVFVILAVLTAVTDITAAIGAMRLVPSKYATFITVVNALVIGTLTLCSLPIVVV